MTKKATPGSPPWLGDLEFVESRGDEDMSSFSSSVDFEADEETTLIVSGQAASANLDSEGRSKSLASSREDERTRLVLSSRDSLSSDKLTAISHSTPSCEASDADAENFRSPSQLAGENVHRADLDGQFLAFNGRGIEGQMPSKDAAQTHINAMHSDLIESKVLANTFMIRELLASGGLGETYRVRHRDLATEHAIKMLLPTSMTDAGLLSLFAEEARLLQLAKNECIVEFQAFLRDADDHPLLVMEYLRGGTLAKRLREGALSSDQISKLSQRIGAGLEMLHGKGIVHNDLSPDNIMLAGDDCSSATIIDFGLARGVDSPDILYNEIDFGGKYSWCSPEQLSNGKAPVDSRSDVYSFGLVIAAAASGKRLDMGHDHASALAARQCVPALDGIEAELAEVLRSMLQPDANERMQSISSVLSFFRPARGRLFSHLFRQKTRR